MIFRALFALLVAQCFSAAGARANDFREPYIGTRAQAMGGAYVALADDEQAVYLNPAGLAGNQKRSLYLLNSDSTVSKETYSSAASVAKAFAPFSTDSLNVLMNKNIYLREQLTPTLMLPYFGISYLVDQQIASRAMNRAMPKLTIGYQTTQGIQAAIGIPLLRGMKKKKHDLRFGIGAKMMWRRGGYKTLSLRQILNISPSTLSQIGGEYKRGLGADLGLQYVYKPVSRLTLSSGLAYTDIGDTYFGSTQDPMHSNLTWGAAASYTLYRIKFTLAYDYRHLLDETDFRKKNHVGFELGIPWFSLYAGLNQVSFTYGLGMDLWLFKVIVANYTEELGSIVRQNPEQRWAIKIALKIDI